MIVAVRPGQEVEVERRRCSPSRGSAAPRPGAGPPRSRARASDRGAASCTRRRDPQDELDELHVEERRARAQAEAGAALPDVLAEAASLDVVAEQVRVVRPPARHAARPRATATARGPRSKARARLVEPFGRPGTGVRAGRRRSAGRIPNSSRSRAAARPSRAAGAAMRQERRTSARRAGEVRAPQAVRQQVRRPAEHLVAALAVEQDLDAVGRRLADAGALDQRRPARPEPCRCRAAARAPSAARPAGAPRSARSGRRARVVVATIRSDSSAGGQSGKTVEYARRSGRGSSPAAVASTTDESTPPLRIVPAGSSPPIRSRDRAPQLGPQHLDELVPRSVDRAAPLGPPVAPPPPPVRVSSIRRAPPTRSTPCQHRPVPLEVVRRDPRGDHAGVGRRVARQQFGAARAGGSRTAAARPAAPCIRHTRSENWSQTIAPRLLPLVPDDEGERPAQALRQRAPPSGATPRRPPRGSASDPRRKPSSTTSTPSDSCARAGARQRDRSGPARRRLAAPLQGAAPRRAARARPRARGRPRSGWPPARFSSRPRTSCVQVGGAPRLEPRPAAGCSRRPAESCSRDRRRPRPARELLAHRVAHDARHPDDHRRHAHRVQRLRGGVAHGVVGVLRRRDERLDRARVVQAAERGGRRAAPRRSDAPSSATSGSTARASRSAPAARISGGARPAVELADHAVDRRRAEPAEQLLDARDARRSAAARRARRRASRRAASRPPRRPGRPPVSAPSASWWRSSSSGASGSSSCARSASREPGRRPADQRGDAPSRAPRSPRVRPLDDARRAARRRRPASSAARCGRARCLCTLRVGIGEGEREPVLDDRSVEGRERGGRLGARRPGSAPTPFRRRSSAPVVERLAQAVHVAVCFNFSIFGPRRGSRRTP